MKAQSYKNHIRYYPPHHFIHYPIIMTLLPSVFILVVPKEDSLIWIFISALFVVLLPCFYVASTLCVDPTKPNCLFRTSVPLFFSYRKNIGRFLTSFK